MACPIHRPARGDAWLWVENKERMPLRPLRAVAHAPLRPREGLLDDHPEHDGCGKTQRVPADVSKASR